ncbi:MAG: PAS domain S-box protein [Candidatus Pacebacteria bacterium]|nr:PAS domain S-box protein [Candidatus Paceibacterota bacterium]
MLSVPWKKKESLSFSDSFIFETSPEVIIFLDLRGRIEQINERVHEWLGYKTKDLVGKSVFDLALVTPESKNIIKKNFFRRLKGEKIAPYEIKCFAKNGQIEVGRVTAKIIKKGKFPVGSLIMISNVTRLEVELEKNLEEARFSEIRYKSLFDNIKSAALICDKAEDKDGFTIKEVNKYFLKLEKYNKKDILGKKLRVIFPGIKKEDICRVVSKAWQDAESSKFTFNINNGRGPTVIEGNVYHLPTDEMLVIYDDITVLVESAKETEEREGKFRNLFEYANDSIFLMDGKVFIDCNKKTLEIYGCDKREDIVGKTPLDFSPLKQPDGMSSQRKALKYIRNAFQGKSQKFYWQHTKKNGELFDAEVSLNRVKISDKVFVQAIVRDITKQKETLDKLEESENNLRTAQKVAKIGHWVWHIKSGELEWSDQIYNIFEVKYSFKPTYKKFLGMVQQNDRDRVVDFVNQSLKTGTYQVDHRIVTGKGKIRIVQEQGKVIYDKKNKPVQMIGVVQDVTKEKLALEKLERNENRLQSLFDNNRDALFLAEVKTRKLVAVNKKAVELMGYSKKELLAMTADQLHPSDIVKDTMKDFQKQAQGKIDLVDSVVLTKTGQRTFVSIGVSTYVGEDGIEYTQGSFRDVSARRKAELELKDSEQKLRTIVTNAQAIIFIIGKDGKFVLSEGQKLEVLGLKPGQVIGVDALEMYKDFPVVIQGIKDAFKGKYSRGIAKVGEIYFDIFYSPYHDNEGNVIGMIGMAIDVTESEKAKARLIEIDQAKSEFISMASHQLRTPLGNIRWELEGILRDEAIKENKLLSKSLNVIYKHDLRLIDLVNNLLNISRIEGQRVMDKPERLNVIQIIKEVIEESEQSIIESNLEIHFHEAEKLMITYDKKLIREVLSNLITNAIKFNQKNGVVVIKADKNDHKFTFEIANTGPIITKYDQEHIFEKFYRGQETKEYTAGTGLGLHITKSYIEKWNGTISFKSPANFSERSMSGQKYKGTIFSVELPTTVK